MEEKLLKIFCKGGDLAIVLIICLALFVYMYIKVIDLGNRVDSINSVVSYHTEQMADMKLRHLETEALLQEIRANVAYIKGKIEKE